MSEITSVCNICGFTVKGGSVAEIVRMGEEHLATHPEPESVPPVVVGDRYRDRKDLDL